MLLFRLLAIDASSSLSLSLLPLHVVSRDPISFSFVLVILLPNRHLALHRAALLHHVG
jgi:hypothetical protein